MTPLIESDLAVLAILLLLIGVCAVVAWFVERRAWYRHGALPNVTRDPDVLPPPNPRAVVRRRWNVPE